MASAKVTAMPRECRQCEEPLKVGTLKCVLCGTWNMGISPKTKGKNDGTFLLSEVKSADLQRLDAGPFNFVWSGFPEKGLVRTSVTLLGGLPGSGKTTMLLQLLDLFAEQTQSEVGFIAAEMAPEELKLYSDRLCVKNHNLVRIIPALTGTCNVGEVLATYNFGVVILDSLQGLVGEDDAASVEVCKICKQHATEKSTPIVIISHVTKDGDYAGLMKLQHEVDTLMLITVDETNGVRSVEILKNRFGKAHIHSDFAMTEAGLIPYIETDEESDDDNDDE